jgi:hypothetical protein
MLFRRRGTGQGEEAKKLVPGVEQGWNRKWNIYNIFIFNIIDIYK